MKIQRLIGLIFLLSCFSATSYAQPEAGDWEFAFSGAGNSHNEFASTNLSASADVGWFTTKALEIGLRQDIGFNRARGSDGDNHNLLDGGTFGFVDYHLDFDAFQPFIGASLGARYGAEANENFYIGPEAGIKYYVRPKVFLVGRMSYLFQVDKDPDQASASYALGVGFDF